nr:leucine-rich repeat domain-containing protein [uncultured Caproiciproducens sp.]
MKTCKCKILSLISLFTILFGMVQIGSAAPVAASTDFMITNGVLTKYYGSKNCVTIPSTVKSIGEEAFNECTDMIEIIIPNSVTAIGRYAFEQCSGLKKVTIPNSVTSIGNYAFDQCTSLKSVTLSNNLKSIGIKTFNGCTSLTKITIPDNVTSIEKYAFEECTSLKSATISSSVKSIGLDAFDGCDDLTISGYQNTPIQTYAKKNGISFKSIGVGSLTLDTKNYTIAPKSSYTIGAKLVGTGLTLKVNSSKSTIAKVVKVNSKEYKVTGLKVGTTYINFNVYDKSGKQLAHASVKIVVKRGVTSKGSSATQVAKF